MKDLERIKKCLEKDKSFLVVSTSCFGVEGTKTDIMTLLAFAILTLIKQKCLKKEDIERCIKLGTMSDEELINEFKSKLHDVIDNLV